MDLFRHSLAFLEEGGFKNRCWQVSQILQPGEIPEDAYDFVYAFSVFTHLLPRAFWTNLDVLRKSIRSPGNVYFTVRHLEFIEHRYPEKVDEVSAALESEGFWFASTEGDLGTAVVSEERLRNALGPVEYLGPSTRPVAARVRFEGLAGK